MFRFKKKKGENIFMYFAICTLFALKNANNIEYADFFWCSLFFSVLNKKLVSKNKLLFNILISIVSDS